MDPERLKTVALWLIRLVIALALIKMALDVVISQHTFMTS